MYEQYADDCYRREWLLGSEEQLDVLDVGSHVGAFAINLATARPTVHVECYEPSPHSARYLRSNVAANGVADRVRVHETAMAAEVGEAVLEDNVGASVHNGLVTGGHRLVSGEVSPGTPAAIRVPTTTFDRAVAAAPRPFDVVKMDCEGVEYELVYASTPSSWASVKRIVMEYHPVAGQSWEQLRSWFEDHGFRVVRQHSTGPGLGTAWLARSS
jgi:FkbM family methyltransferase